MNWNSWLRRVFFLGAILLAAALLTFATSVLVPGSIQAASPVQLPPIGPVDSDDDPNEVEDGLPDDILDPEDLVAPPPPATTAPAPQSVPTSTQQQTTVAPRPAPTPPAAQPSAMVAVPTAVFAASAAPATAPLVIASESCEIVRTQHTVQRVPEQVVIEVRATGSQEVPLASTDGSAFGRFVFHESSSTLEYFVTNFGFSPNLVTAAHIHRGPSGINGPIVHFISATGFMQATGRLQLSTADVADLKAGNFYLNLHSLGIPAGYARGQLLFPAPETIVRTIEEQVCRTTVQTLTQPPVAAPVRPVVSTSGRGASVGGISAPSAGDAGLAFDTPRSGLLLFAIMTMAASTTVLATIRRRS